MSEAEYKDFMWWNRNRTEVTKDKDLFRRFRARNSKGGLWVIPCCPICKSEKLDAWYEEHLVAMCNDCDHFAPVVDEEK